MGVYGRSSRRLARLCCRTAGPLVHFVGAGPFTLAVEAGAWVYTAGVAGALHGSVPEQQDHCCTCRSRSMSAYSRSSRRLSQLYSRKAEQ
eukprot:1142069-Pelagomonas_calceolata.AAC.2